MKALVSLFYFGGMSWQGGMSCQREWLVVVLGGWRLRAVGERWRLSRSWEIFVLGSQAWDAFSGRRTDANSLKQAHSESEPYLYGRPLGDSMTSRPCENVFIRLPSISLFLSLIFFLSFLLDDITIMLWF